LDKLRAPKLLDWQSWADKRILTVDECSRNPDKKLTATMKDMSGGEDDMSVRLSKKPKISEMPQRTLMMAASNDLSYLRGDDLPFFNRHTLIMFKKTFVAKDAFDALPEYAKDSYLVEDESAIPSLQSALAFIFCGIAFMKQHYEGDRHRIIVPGEQLSYV
jgi:phage/plasmid-associated DNA primase